ncbi:MAG: copper chaperone PCu(A)C [Alphaproteobacteria bacterium]|nr:copper chaperone PCu(A)C [Alphaproteobacteria bacterium]MBU1560717.1 copper chaperone PCu(A)C [Alphaproteobacteria bacterium]MBU2302926.1 copper chaperone PCu(A)C [Alphaproteobacteria bacterium]MBU2367653.1 copper chaperone PCu(A)C [Alphaproteobacteria bacterium]
MHKLILAGALAMFSTATLAHDFTSGSIYIDHPMIQEAPPNAPVLGGYVTIHNNGDTADRLLAIESPVADKVELHQSVVTDGIARMQPMVSGLEVPAGEIVWLGDNGTHAMFVKPDRRYRAGDEIPATLVFEKAGRVDVTFKVEERSTVEGPGHEGHVR